jgi:hypothetical protein
MKINFSQLASKMFVATGITPPESMAAVVASIQSGVTPEQARIYREFVTAYNAKLIEKQDGDAGRERLSVHVNSKLKAMWIPPTVNTSVRDSEIKMLAEQISDSRLIQEALNALDHQESIAQNCETPKKSKQSEPAKTVVAIDPVADSQVAYEQDAFTEISANKHLTDADAINSIRNIRDLVRSGADSDDLIAAINRAIATTEVMLQRSKKFNGMPEFTDDGWQMILRYRPMANYADEFPKDKYKSYKTAWNSADIKLSPKKFNEHCKYYVYAVACDKSISTTRKGITTCRQHMVYLGEYETIRDVAERGEPILAREWVGRKKDGCKQKFLTEIAPATLAWRQEQADLRDATLI